MLKILLSQVKEYKLPSIMTPVWMIGEVICEMITPVLMGKIIDDGINGGNMDYIIRTGILMLIVALIGFLFGTLGGFSGAKAAAGFAKNLRKAMFRNIQSFSFANIDKFSTSSLVTRLTTDVTNIQNSYMVILRMAVRAPMTLIIAVIMSLMIDAKMACIYLGAIGFLTVVILILMKNAAKYFREVFKKYDALNESVRENVSAIRIVKAYVREDHEISKFQKAAVNIYLTFVKAEGTVVTILPVMMGTVYACMILISWFGANRIVYGSLTTGGLMSLLAYCMNIMMSLIILSVIFVMITMSEASARRIVEVLTEETELHNPENPVMEVPDGRITFEQVDFSYNKTAEEPVLKQVCLDIHSGEMIGIIGGTGSAKSSLVNLISRLYDVSKGSVSVGGHDVREYDLDVLRKRVAVVLQTNILFSGTIYDNLRWGNPEATDEQCQEACRIACAEEFIRRIPEGYNKMISQGGTNVSGGQKQRLCIARALLRDPKVLILDDSTSAVDTATDAKIRDSFRNRMPEVTKLIIAQRISSVQDCDRIIVMEDGRVDGFDTHENLLRTNRIYQEIYESQTGANAEADFDSKERG
ncbi:MAG: ABC transporter ATP-binding protein [Eubacterium sp.]|nr:ABC transporter ATP-binding protein [Eubacterium sp.]